MKTFLVVALVLAVVGTGGYFLWRKYLRSAPVTDPKYKQGTAPKNPLESDFAKLGVDLGQYGGKQIGGVAGSIVGNTLSGLGSGLGTELGKLFD